MKITVTKVKRELAKKFHYDVDGLLIKRIILIIDEQLIKHKNITIVK